MKISKRVETFTDKYPFAGPFLWVVQIQYFIANLLAALNWPKPYSFLSNTISDLGNTSCGIYSGRYVCSPLYPAMDASFFVLGVSMAIGSILIYHEFKKNQGTKIAFSLMSIAGLGAALVGLFPENVSGHAHVIGAVLALMIGNIAIIIFGFVLELPGFFKAYTIATGLIALVAFFLFVTKHNLGIGQGGMERISSYPQTIWLIIFGGYIRRDHFKSIAVKLVRRHD